MRVIVYPPTVDWHWMKQRPQQLMSGLARCGYTVYFCNKTRSGERTKRIGDDLFLVSDHERWLREEWPSIRARCRSAGVWCTLPHQAASLAAYEPDWIVYDCADEFAEWIAYEAEIAAIADLFVCTAEPICRRLRRTYPHKRIELIRNGYDPAMGLHEPESGSGGAETIPEDLPADKPIIGYVGAWAPWVDAELVGELSLLAAKAEAEVVVIGPEYGRRYSNGRPSRIRFLGLKPHEQLARYIRRLSVCLIPFRPTPVTLATNPVKAYEYLASGRPVVSSDMPECRRMQPHIDIAAGRRQFIELALHRLRQPGDAAARRQYALGNTWAHRAQQAAAALQSIEKGCER